jgi:ABC-type bacteriocin/lantibiotic exporter with double-glycine peptidase domain
MPAKIRLVKQRRTVDCGVACVAMVSGYSYATAKAAIAEDDDSRSLRTDNANLRGALARLGVKVGSRAIPRSTFAGLNRRSIVAINYDRKRNTWHWVVFEPDPKGGFVLDPRPTVKRNKRRDLHNLKIEWYLPLTRSRVARDSSRRRAI